jgi:3-hydroxybutyryl-CoA dehydrogenase
MGPLIAMQTAIHGIQVCLIDSSQKALDNAKRVVGENLERRTQNDTHSEMAEITSLIKYGIGVENMPSDVDFVIESITEDLDIKLGLFEELDKTCPPHTILATNSSSIRSSLLAPATKRQDKVLNMHFLYTPQDRPIVEVMGSDQTSTETIEATVTLGKRIGLTPVVISGEITGFVFNRIWRGIKHEVLRIVNDGHASFEDVDRAFMMGIPAPMGPFMGMDKIGLDVILAVEERWYTETGDERDKPAEILVEKVTRGELGVKTGKGFYTYPNPNYEKPGWLHKQ